jgi:Flp pilus assembly protein TadG
MRKLHRKPGQSGNGAIEFAIGFSLLWALFSGVFQYGYSMYVYNALQSAVVDGASYASRGTICAENNDFRDQVRGMVVFGDPSATSGTPAVPNLTLGHVTVQTNPSAFPNTVTVRITNFTVNALFQSFTFSNKPAVTMPFLGVYQAGSC